MARGLAPTPAYSKALDWATYATRCTSALLASSSKVSLASIAREVGLSPTFTAGLMRDKAIRTRRMDRFVAIEQRE